MNDTTGRIVDLDEQKVYDLDIKKKNYTVTTFEQLGRSFAEAQEQAAKEAKDAQVERGSPPAMTSSSSSISTSRKPGRPCAIAGHDARQVIMTVTVREKGKTLEESGGVAIRFLAGDPTFPPCRLAEFEMN